MTADPPPLRNPFPQRGSVRKTAWRVPMDDAVTAATAAGFRVTPRSGPSRVHVQRNLWTAATIRPTHGGVVVKPAWTPAQIAVVIVVLALLLCGGGVL